MSVANQDQKSQLKNKEKALKILRTRIYDNMVQAQKSEIDSERRGQIGDGDRSEIDVHQLALNGVASEPVAMTVPQTDQ